MNMMNNIEAGLMFKKANEAIIENLKWKIQFYEKQIEKTKKQIKQLKKGDIDGK